MLRIVIFLVSLGARAIRAMCRRRADLMIENLALRQQVPATARGHGPSILGCASSLVAQVGAPLTRRLVRMMAQDGWGAPRIHAELTKLGFLVSEMTVSRYLPRRPTEPDQVKRWAAFLRNRKDEIAATVTHGESRCIAESGWTAPPVRMARGSTAPSPPCVCPAAPDMMRSSWLGSVFPPA